MSLRRKNRKPSDVEVKEEGEGDAYWVCNEEIDGVGDHHLVCAKKNPLSTSTCARCGSWLDDDVSTIHRPSPSAPFSSTFSPTLSRTPTLPSLIPRATPLDRDIAEYESTRADGALRIDATTFAVTVSSSTAVLRSTPPSSPAPSQLATPRPQTVASSSTSPADQEAKMAKTGLKRTPTIHILDQHLLAQNPELIGHPQPPAHNSPEANSNVQVPNHDQRPDFHPQSLTRKPSLKERSVKQMVEVRKRALSWSGSKRRGHGRGVSVLSRIGEEGEGEVGERESLLAGREDEPVEMDGGGEGVKGLGIQEGEMGTGDVGQQVVESEKDLEGEKDLGSEKELQGGKDVEGEVLERSQSLSSGEKGTRLTGDAALMSKFKEHC